LNDCYLIYELLDKKSSTLDFSNVCRLFDCLINDYGDAFETFLSTTSDIVADKDLENGVLKVLNSYMRLTEFEKTAMIRLEQFDKGGDDAMMMVNDDSDAVDLVLDGEKWMLRPSPYIDLKSIPVTSNLVDQCPRSVKGPLSYWGEISLESNLQLKSKSKEEMMPEDTVHAIMFLKLNMSLLTKVIVQLAVKRLQEQRKERKKKRRAIKRKTNAEGEEEKSHKRKRI
jgi:hypothetical protein